MRKVLTSIEKLDGAHPGLGTAVRIWLDKGVPVQEVKNLLKDRFGATITKEAVAYHRANRWWPLRERIQDESIVVKAIIQEVGGDAGVDEFMSARLLEQVRALTHDELIEAKELFVKIRAQNLKEQEFLFKSGQLKHKKSEDGGEGDAAAEEAKTKRVMNKIRGIFGLDPLPDESSDQETEARSPEADAANEGKIEPPANRATEPAENPLAVGESAGAVMESGS